MAGSGLFSKMHAALSHLLTHGLSAEVANVRKDINATISPLAGITVEEFLAPAAAAPAGLAVAAASTVAIQTVNAFLAPGIAALLAGGRNVTLTTAGATPADAPATALVTGTGTDNKPLTETITVAQTATIANGVKIFKTITSVVYAAGDGVGATISIGWGLKLGLTQVPKLRGGASIPTFESLDGVALSPATGVISATNKSYLPATAPNAAHNYCVYYELDGTTIIDA